MHLAIMFITMVRHHYNKATLSWIGDCNHQQDQFPGYYNTKTALCSVITEKKVEVFHSKLRSRIRKTDNGDKTQETARLLTRSNCQDQGFEQTYVPVYKRGYSDIDLLVSTGNQINNLCIGFAVGTPL